MEKLGFEDKESLESLQRIAGFIESEFVKAEQREFTYKQISEKFK